MSKATVARRSAQHRQLPPPRAATTVRLEDLRVTAINLNGEIFGKWTGVELLGHARATSEAYAMLNRYAGTLGETERDFLLRQFIGEVQRVLFEAGGTAGAGEFGPGTTMHTTVEIAASPKPRVSLRQAHDDLAVAVSVKAVSLAAGGA